jgi:hypothetical protein
MWEKLQRRAASVITDLNGVERYVTQSPHEIKQLLPRALAKEGAALFLIVDVVAKSKGAGQLPRTVLDDSVPETINVNQIALVERITSPFLAAEKIGVSIRDTESFRTHQSSGSSRREFAHAGR